MKLREFIRELEKISKSISNPNKVQVEMADGIPVVIPIFKDGVIFITDSDLETKFPS